MIIKWIIIAGLYLTALFNQYKHKQLVTTFNVDEKLLTLYGTKMYLYYANVIIVLIYLVLNGFGQNPSLIYWFIFYVFSLGYFIVLTPNNDKEFNSKTMRFIALGLFAVGVIRLIMVL